MYLFHIYVQKTSVHVPNRKLIEICLQQKYPKSCTMVTKLVCTDNTLAKTLMKVSILQKNVVLITDKG